MKLTFDPVAVHLHGYDKLLSEIIVTTYSHELGIAATVTLHDTDLGEEDGMDECLVSIDLSAFDQYPENGSFFLHMDYEELGWEMEKQGLGRMGEKIPFGLRGVYPFHIDPELLRGQEKW